eukprot:2876054-Rhodomonas_salina.1
MASALPGLLAGEDVPLKHLTLASRVGENVPIMTPPARRTQGRTNVTIKRHLVPTTRSSTAMVWKST